MSNEKKSTDYAIIDSNNFVIGICTSTDPNSVDSTLVKLDHRMRGFTKHNVIGHRYDPVTHTFTDEMHEPAPAKLEYTTAEIENKLEMAYMKNLLEVLLKQQMPSLFHKQQAFNMKRNEDNANKTNDVVEMIKKFIRENPRFSEIELLNKLAIFKLSNMINKEEEDELIRICREAKENLARIDALDYNAHRIEELKKRNLI